MTHRFYLVDVFAERPCSGNQLAVVVVGEQSLPDRTMQLLAAEMNYSETTFATPVPQEDGGYPMRIFTPAREIAFAGHPILGTAWALRQLLSPDSCAPPRLNLAVGQICVSFEIGADGREAVWFLAPTIAPGADLFTRALAAALGISPLDIEPGSPVQQLSAGTSAMIVPQRSLDALRRSKLDLTAYAGLAAQGHPAPRLPLSAGKRITPQTTSARGSSSRRMACARTRPAGTPRPSSVRTSWSTGSCPTRASPCESSRAMKLAGRPWSCCAQG